MSQAVLLQHASSFGPGRVVSVFRDFGIPCDLRQLHRGDELPADLDEVRVLVLLSGPQRVADVGSEKAPFLAGEVELVRRMIEQDRPVLAIGLGAQLLAHAAGAKVYPNAKPGATPDAPGTPMPNHGWGTVTFPFPGGTEPMVFGMVDGSPMFFWHTDTFDLPKLPAPANPAPPPAPPPPTGNSLITSSPLVRNAAFRFKTRLFGFQYHFELLEEDIERILSGESVAGVDAAAIRSQTPQHYARYARLGERLLTNYVQFLKTYNPPTR
jgi:GMP synthase (glutamine-hydrolysing)